MSGSGSSVAAPQIRFFQFEDDNLGVFNKSVNLFRGDLNYNQHLVKMPGRKGGADMDIDISIQYQSNLGESVTTQNLDAPTSVVGLGWSLPMDRISLQQNGCFSLGARSYSIASNGIESRLILEKVENGLEYYQPVSYEFWLITYDPKNEVWEIKKENGNRYIYGGGLSFTPNGYRQSTGNSIAWGVRYGNWMSNTLIGGSNSNAQPNQFAREWYLSAVISPWGEQISYEYNGFARGSDGLIAGVEQMVGDIKGLPYTKAVYITKVTDVFGRCAIFSYNEKTYDNSSPENPREYQFAHDLLQQAPGHGMLNGYQDLYETKFLQQVTIYKRNNELLRILNFEYLPLVNLTQHTGNLKGDTFKRYLAGINTCVPDGTSLPGVSFSYYTDTSLQNANIGALQSVTVPTGAVAVYTYQMQSLDICNRNITINKPGSEIMGSDNSVPRVWFGEDFTVMTWYNNDNGRLMLSVYTWLGYWKVWSPDDPIIYNQPNGIVLNGLDVLISDSSFALHFSDNTNTYLFLYGKDQRQAGKWIAYNNHGNSGFSFPYTMVQFRNGNDFVAALVTDVNAGTQSITRATWNWYAGKWIVESNVLVVNTLSQSLIFTTAGEYYFTLAWSQASATAQLQLNYLLQTASALPGWNSSEAVSLSNIIVDTDHFLWGTGASILALAVITGDTDYVRNYDLYVIQWEENYKVMTPYKTSFVTMKDDHGQLPVNIAPQVIANSMIITGENLLRFNGKEWLVSAAFQNKQPSSLFEYWYSAGVDYMLRTINQPQGVINFELLAYDPNSTQDINNWSTLPILPQPLPVAPVLNPRNAYHPAAGGADYFSNGVDIYYRGSSTDWSAAVSRPVYTISDAIDSTTLINQAPDFLAYLVPDILHPDQSKMVVLPLKNGLVRDSGTILPQQIYNLYPSGKGSASCGPATLITFPADTFRSDMDFAESFTLYRYAGHAISGNIVHYPVKTLEVADGFGVNYSTAYVFDAVSAACDPSGTVMKYFKSTVYAGTADSSTPAFGSTVHHYINGYNNQENITYYLNGKEYNDSPAYPVLDGLKHSVEFFDNNNVQIRKQQFLWDVFTLRNNDPLQLNTVLTYGSFTRQHGLMQALDGVQETMTQVYIPENFEAPFSGLLIAQNKSNFNGQGIEEKLVTQKKYGYECYPGMASIHQLDIVTQEIQSIVTAGQSSITVGSKVNTWKAGTNGAWAKYQSIKWNGAENGLYPFPLDYSVPAGWLCADSNTLVDDLGIVREMSNVQQQLSTVLYDSNDEFVIAQFRNASIQNGEADYFGFEAIEAGVGWMLNGDATIVDGNAYTGFRSLSIGKGGSLSKTFNLKAGRKFIAGYWYKTLPGYVAANGSGWSVSTGDNTDVTSAISGSKNFTDTKGLWQFDFVLIDTGIMPEGQSLSLNVHALNNADEQVWVDNVRWIPESGDFSAFVYHPYTNQMIVQMGSGAFLERVTYDRFNRRIANSIPGGDSLSAIYMDHYSLQQNTAFNPGDPNAQIQIKALDGGFNELCTDAFGWQQRWTASNNETNWQTTNGMISHTNGEENDTLSCSIQNLNSDYALAFALCAGPTGIWPVLNDAIGIKLGADASFIWQPAAQTFTFTVFGKPYTALWQTAGTPLYWTLIVKRETIIFYADGRLLLSVITNQSAVAQPVINTGHNLLHFNFLAVALKPMTGLVYKDGLGFSRQNHVLSGANAIINHQLCNAVGKSVVKTKSAPAFFGTTVNNTPLLVYRPGFVNVDDFLQNVNGTGIMKGEVSDYYNGTNGASDDGGYPYSRKLLEFSPLMRMIEKGAPGKDYAIIHPLQSPSLRKTVKYQYTNNKQVVVTGLEDLPQGEYYVMVMKQQNGVPVYQLKDKTGAVLVKGMPADENAINFSAAIVETSSVNLINRRHVVHDASGRTIFRYMPAYFNGAGGGNNSFQTSSRYDALNNMVQTSTPDNGIVLFVYNNAGQLRFQQDAEGAANGYFGYYKYDALNRITEQGILFEPWNKENLTENAELPNYPAALPGQQVQKKSVYTSFLEGDIALNKIKTSWHYADDNSGAVIQENFAYNESSQPLSVTTIIQKPDKSVAQYTIGYEYLVSGLVSAVTYPSAQSSIDKVYYFYDDIGRLMSIGRSPADPSYYAAYTYTPQNDVNTVSMNNGALSTNHQYLPTGWLQSMQSAQHTTGFNETIGAYSENGSVKSLSDEMNGTGLGTTIHLDATYNQNNLMSAVTSDTENDWSLSDMQYDSNGNLLSLSANGVEEVYTYQAGTNKVVQVTHNGTAILSLQYNLNGGVAVSTENNTGGKGKTFTYLKNGYLTTGIDDAASGESHRYYYGSKGRRMLKQTLNGENLTAEKAGIFGSYALPLLEVDNEGVVTYIYGPSGLVAFEKKSSLYFVIKDHLGSSRMVYDIHNNVAAVYAYSSFGHNKVILETVPGLLSYLYTGQEWLPEVGLYNFRARLYDARLRRFYQTDPRYQFVGAYIFNGQNPLTFIDPTGMWSFWDIFSEIAQWIIDAVELVVGIVADVVSFGGLSEVGGGTLIGAGLNSMASIIEANAKGQPLSWVKFGEAQVVGEVAGTVSAGIGVLGDILADAISDGVGNLVNAAYSQSAKLVSNIAFKVVVAGPAGGILSNVGGTFVSNLFAVGLHEPDASLDAGLGTAAWMGTVMGVIGSGLGEVGGGISKNMPKAGKIVVGVAAGIVNGSIGGLITWADKKGDFSWVSFGLSITSGTIEAFSGSLKSANAPEDPQAAIARQQARRALLSDQDDVYGGGNAIQMNPLTTDI